MTQNFESVIVKKIRVFDSEMRVRQHREIDIRIDVHRGGNRLMVEADVVQDQDDATTSSRLSVLGSQWTGGPENRELRTENRSALRNKNPDQNAQEAEDRNKSEEGDGAE